ncbi:MAG TPA: LCP family protein [Patescibacteria group bacterium]|nr:LCP family protein [Patescibacteria group bacterium]
MFKKENPIRINFVDTAEERSSRSQTYVFAAVFTAVVAFVATIAAYASYQAATRGTDIFSELGRAPVISNIGHLFGSTQKDPAAVDHMNILFLGIGGDGHDGALLTDTMLLVSLDIKGKHASILSIPRDLAYPLGNGQFEKINAVDAYAEQDHPGEGAVRTADAVSKLLDVPIDHAIRVDFRGFSDFIDALGGIDVTVQQSFTDYQYPTADDKWTTVSFKQGIQHMSGSTALVFVRSRHGNNGEGSDFARSRRQQIVMLAVRNKLLSLGTISDPQKLAALWSAVANHIQTDLSPWDILRIAPLASSFSPDRITTHVLTDAPDGELVAANVNGAYMLFPKKPDWSQIREIAQNPFTDITPTSTKSIPPAVLTRVEIKNGTTRTGFAAQVAAWLEKNNYDIMAFGNAVRRGYERTIIFDLTGGKKPAELATLKKLLDADVSTTLPSWITTASGTSSRVVYGDGLAPERILSSNSDFLIILGEASYGLLK